MRKFSILIQLRFIYVYMFIYLVIGYFYDSYLKHIGLYKFIETYFGISFFFILFLVLLDFYSYFIRCSRKKMVYSTRKFFFCILVISCIFLYFMYNLNIPLKKDLADEKANKSVNFDEAVKERVKMLDIAKQYNLDKIDTLSNKDIKIAVIKKVNGDFNIDNKSEEYIDGMFDVCSEQQINIDSASASKRRIINGKGKARFTRSG